MTRVHVCLCAQVRRDLKLLLGAGLAEVLNAVFPVLACRKPANTILVPTKSVRYCICAAYKFIGMLLSLFLDSDVGRLRRNLVQTTAIMRGFWVLPACYPRCVLCLLSIDAPVILTYLYPGSEISYSARPPIISNLSQKLLYPVQMAEPVMKAAMYPLSSVLMSLLVSYEH